VDIRHGPGSHGDAKNLAWTERENAGVGNRKSRRLCPHGRIRARQQQEQDQPGSERYDHSSFHRLSSSVIRARSTLVAGPQNAFHL
jgi:hypothetical protein